MVAENAVFAVLNHETRRRLLVLLLRAGELCVCELFSAVDVPQAIVSRHLAMARAAGLVLARRQGTWMHYRLHPDLAPWVQAVLVAIGEGPSQDIFAHDRQRLEAVAPRTVRCCVAP
jgi:ArsR family transcriptional regulator